MVFRGSRAPRSQIPMPGEPQSHGKRGASGILLVPLIIVVAVVIVIFFALR
jgi:hypothetical protein